MELTWQAALFDEPSVEVARRDLDATAWVEHAPGWLARPDDLFAELVAGGEWRQKDRWMYEQRVTEPRLTTVWPIDALPGRLVDVRCWLDGRYRVEFDSCFVNLYRDGADSVAWHRDRVHREMAEPVVAIVSLGERRPLRLRPRGGGPSLKFELGQGDLFVMGGTTQQTWEHCVPKRKAAAPRMSVTFRHSKPGAYEVAA
ncbi:MAG: putative alkylated repair protein [Acidimicrobiales bacterium]|jgi:alkylated DNA repair dioxygenase AlkB|nr:putative alkylated repair protein [Acidimicrobiales bacterium]